MTRKISSNVNILGEIISLEITKTRLIIFQNFCELRKNLMAGEIGQRIGHSPRGS